MALREELERQGDWLFRWRSYLPLILIPILPFALRDTGNPMGYFYEVLCITISFIGLIIRCITVGYVPEGTSGRNTKGQRAEILNTTGMYSIVRHPLYLGNFIISLGLVFFIQAWWFKIITVLAFWLYYERIMFKEEEFLRKKFGDRYLEWSERTPAFLPRFKRWQKSVLPFSLKNVLKREYPGFFGMIASFTFLKTVKAILYKKRLVLSLAWSILFIIGLVVYLTLRTLKKRTKVLDAVKGIVK